MIVAEQKPLPEIRRMISPYERVLIVGCGTCMTVCDAGGEREVAFLHDALRMAQSRDGNETHHFLEATLKRQCEPEFLEMLVDKTSEVDVILSLGCGIGVQAIAERFPDTPVLPGVNTSFMGISREQGVWDERCAACGECRRRHWWYLPCHTVHKRDTQRSLRWHQKRKVRSQQGHGLCLGSDLQTS